MNTSTLLPRMPTSLQNQIILATEDGDLLADQLPPTWQADNLQTGAAVRLFPFPNYTDFRSSSG